MSVFFHFNAHLVQVIYKDSDIFDTTLQLRTLVRTNGVSSIRKKLTYLPVTHWVFSQASYSQEFCKMRPSGCKK